MARQRVEGERARQREERAKAATKMASSYRAFRLRYYILKELEDAKSKLFALNEQFASTELELSLLSVAEKKINELFIANDDLLTQRAAALKAVDDCCAQIFEKASKEIELNGKIEALRLEVNQKEEDLKRAHAMMITERKNSAKIIESLQNKISLLSPRIVLS
jgi:hypothetical protein